MCTWQISWECLLRAASHPNHNWCFCLPEALACLFLSPGRNRSKFQARSNCTMAWPCLPISLKFYSPLSHLCLQQHKKMGGTSFKIKWQRWTVMEMSANNSQTENLNAKIWDEEYPDSLQSSQTHWWWVWWCQATFLEPWWCRRTWQACQ